jgi:ankyrin repeat protein
MAQREERDENNFTPLHNACESGDLGEVERLIRAGALKNARTSFNFTPLHLAIQGGHLEVVKCLLNNDGQVNSLNNLPLFSFFRFIK